MKSLTLTFSLSLISIFAFGQVNLYEGLMAHYPFSGDALDVSGNDHHAEINGPELTEDCFGASASAYIFDGIDDYMEVVSSEDLDFDIAEEFAISLLFKPELFVSGNNIADLISKWSSANLNDPYSYSVRIWSQDAENIGVMNAARFDGNLCNGATRLESQESILDAEWHHLVFQKSGTDLTLYVDGELIESTFDESICSTISSSNIFFGDRSNTNSRRPYRGALDEIRIYNRALTIDEIEFLNDSKVVTNTVEYDLEDLLLTPNPVFSEFNIINHLGVEILESTIYSSRGVRIANFKGTSYKMDDYSSGLYFLIIEFNDGYSRMIKLIKA